MGCLEAAAKKGSKFRGLEGAKAVGAGTNLISGHTLALPVGNEGVGQR